jgi:uncharacterized membrane protein
MSDPQNRSDQPLSGWAVGGVGFAACMLVLIGAFQIVDGLAAIIDDEFFVVGKHYAFDLDTTIWGWIHLVLGILLVLTGFSLFGRRTWAGVAALCLVLLSAFMNFFFIPYYPLWSILVIALDVWVVWSLTRPGVIET